MEPRSRASPEQFSALIEFMESRGDLSKPQPGAQGRVRSDRLWQELACVLNSVGGGVAKTPDKWKKVWADWKTKTKKKYLNIRQHASGTGGGPSSRQALTVLEERVVALLGMTTVTGQPGIQEHGLYSLDMEPSQPIAEGDEMRNDSYENINLIALSPPAPLSPPPPAPAQAASPRAPREPAYMPPPPRTPPPRSSRRQASRSPRSAPSTPRRLQTRLRRNRGLTPFQRAASEFASIEMRRLDLEEARERRLHERESEALRLETQRIDVARQHNHLLQRLCGVAELLITTLNQRPGSLPSTEPLPDH